MQQLREQSGVDETAGGTNEPPAESATGISDASRSTQDYIPVLPEEESRPQRGDVNRQKGRHNKRSLFAARGMISLNTDKDRTVRADKSTACSAKEHRASGEVCLGSASL